MYYLGIDGGGTKTKIVIIDNNSNILYENTAGPSSLDTVTKKITYQNIKIALDDFFKLPKNNKLKFKAVFAGLGGIFSEDDKVTLVKILSKLPGVDKNTILIGESDAENALASGLLFDEGMTLIAGTGMVAYGKNLKKQTHKAGGVGYKEGDLGSSYDLGKNALRAVARAIDNRFVKNAFTDELMEHLGLSTMSDIQNLTELWYLERTKVAGLAPFVTKHANLGNVYAMKICDNATYELSLAVNAVYQTLNLVKPTLVIVGSLGNTDGYFKEKLYVTLKSFIPDLKIIAPQIDPAYAAAKLALYYALKNN